MPALACEDLCKNYGDVAAVDGVGFAVEEGETFGFLGPNGAGKTTTVGMFATLLRPSSGWAEVFDYDVVLEANEVRDHIGLVFQEQAVDNQMSAEDNLVLHALLYGIPRRAARERARYLLDLMDLAARKDHKVSTYSGGMRRRLEIARCLMHEPRLLFLDEPTAGLDPHARALVWELLDGLREKHGVTLFLTTHYLAEAERCDRVAIIDHGAVVAEGTPAALKGTIGKDVVAVRTENDEQAARTIHARLGLDISTSQEGLRIHAVNGPALVPEICSGAGVAVSSVTVSRPTLDDVFLHYTGRSIRPESE